MSLFLVLTALLALALCASRFLQYWFRDGAQVMRQLSKAASRRERCDVDRLPRVDREWQPDDEPGSIEDAIRDLARAGGVMSQAAHLFECALEDARGYGRGDDEIRMAIQYSMNATLSAWRGQGRGVSSGQLRRAIVRAIRDAACLFRAERDDDDGLGAATFGDLARAIAAGAPVARSGLQDPLTPEGDGITSAYDARMWDPASVARALDALSFEERLAVIDRQRTLLSYVEGLFPKASDHRLFLATLLARTGRFGEAMRLCRKGMEDVAPFLEAFRPHGHSAFLAEVFRYAARDLQLLVDLASASEETRPHVPELATYLAAVALAREGREGPGHLAARALLDAWERSPNGASS